MPFQYVLASHVHIVYLKLVESVGHVLQAEPLLYSSAAQHSAMSPPRLVVPIEHSLHVAPSQYSSTAHHLMYGFQSKSAISMMSPSGIYFHESYSPAPSNRRPVSVRSITYPSSLFRSDVIAAVVSMTFPAASLKSILVPWIR